ncbi:MAG TPA: class I SAM-dependent methyltransferase [Candidatus Binatia bacterium]|nr:class I SAM-dependent methyltransferase [Candidatus Binatia bacterium]
MAATADARAFFTARHARYARFIRAVRYAQGLRAYFLAAPVLRPGLRILDAGCGTGALTLAVHEACVRRGAVPAAFHAFDLTPAMLDRLRDRLMRRGVEDVELAEANVLRLDALPPTWRDYDLVVSAGMLEYVPRDRFVDALAGRSCRTPFAAPRSRTSPSAGSRRRRGTSGRGDTSSRRDADARTPGPRGSPRCPAAPRRRLHPGRESE